MSLRNVGISGACALALLMTDLRSEAWGQPRSATAASAAPGAASATRTDTASSTWWGWRGTARDGGAEPCKGLAPSGLGYY